MEQLADKGNGNYFYIDGLNEGKKVLSDELGSTILTVAKDVKIQIEFNPEHVKEYRLVGYENRQLAKEDFNNDAKDAGDMGAGHTVTALYEIVPAGAWESHGRVDNLKYQKQEPKKGWFSNKDELMTVKVRYKEPNSQSSQLITKVLKKSEVTWGRPWNGPSHNLNFASAVAEFGMLLRNSPYKGNASYQSVLQRAQASGYNDTWGYKTEFLELVQRAAALDPNRYQPQPVTLDDVYYPAPGQTTYPTEQSGYIQKGL